ncbi:MAG: zf-HC2 domain-containing protein [Pyrinomonadaceae bacterium]|nr:zf-HC2 domain-containing protein [Pyrinomonadaceae bacterium]
MNYENEKIINCSEFEDKLTDYLDNALDRQTRKSMAEHALKCPLCHSLLNEVKEALKVCHEIAVPKAPLTSLEARILAKTMPETAMLCSEFENSLTDYLDGFLPASFFHRWERHAVLCEKCTDLPGEVVRAIAVCYTYKADELPLPVGLHERIMQATSGAELLQLPKITWKEQLNDWVRGLRFPITIPQLAPMAMMIMLAFFVFSQTVSADGTISGIYQKGVELAQQTYKESSNIWETEKPQNNQEPITSEGNQ